MAAAMPATRGRWLTTAAVLFGILAVSNATKPLQIGPHTGFVFLGERLSGAPNLILGPLFGLFLAAYAAGIWRMRRYAVPMAWLYAAYVLTNLILFPFRTPPPPNPGVWDRLFGIVYAAIAIGVSAGTAVVLTRRAAELR
jgi:hypothetical protein